MGYIININSESKQALAFIEFAKTFDFTEITKVKTKKTALGKPETGTYNAEQQAFRKRMRRNLQQIELLKKGKLKTQPLDEFLKSL
ncbi:hypothetical protein [Capnocytophaga catalasegens]|uniref:30S ribosomal protein S21 n=1 Tax=Capnocytophaga catalasegens TaxID=1004260 RepID=A0AAV5AQ39_9FLAO|nr:hypothetical protein [Capnocytophaga catalasegens]GIZ15058.1 hypothetical protein RCZ03_10580 [Capnocytophaga catalasegens]GJM49438.1 hypothetical protein RCZ15_04130 [Capnocytophaga catalasegens]GJM52588.1 hypothetical protein RCZ16_09050 [Capnocytophaga catalasegens]